MIRNDVLQGDVGFVVGGGRKKGMRDLFTCPDLLVHSCCWEKLVGSKASPKLLVLSPIVSPTKGADGRSCCCSPDPTEPIFPTNSSHMQSLQKPSTPWKKKKKKTSNFVTAFSSPPVSLLSLNNPFPQNLFSLSSATPAKICLSQPDETRCLNERKHDLLLCECVCVCADVSLSLSTFFCLFLKISPSFGRKLAVGWL